jgi:hypothetical protein
MTIDASQPTDAVIGYQLDNFIREDRVEINSLWAGLAAVGWTTGLIVATVKSTTLAAAQATMVNSTDVEDIPFEVVLLTGDVGGNSITNITGCRSGQIKVIIFQDANIKMVYDVTKLDLNSPSADLDAEAKDVLVLVNIGGDPDTSTNGVWQELYRNLDARS